MSSAPRPAPSAAVRVAGAFVLLGGVGTLMLAWPALLGPHGVALLAGWMRGLGWLGPALALAAFTGLAFLGAPQFVLIAAAVLAFGPGEGFAVSWVGTLLSAFVGFAVGRRFGASALAVFGRDRLSGVLKEVGRHGFFASLLVRLAPAAPFVVVNMAAGSTPMSFAAFAAGTALGIVPKIAATAFAGGSAIGAFGHGPLKWAVLVVAVLAWALIGVAGRAWLRRRRAEGDGATGTEGSAPEARADAAARRAGESLALAPKGRAPG